jgi:hypothetical protein
LADDAMLRPKLICCRVMVNELVPLLPPDTEVEVFEISLHTHPLALRRQLQQAIDACDGRYDPIYLGYGLCAQAVVGLTAKLSRLVIPKSDDCIELFLGSRAARLEQLQREPGTLFLTSGYIGDGASMIFADHARAEAKYGKERAEQLLISIMRHYNRLVYIRMPHAADLEADKAYSKAVADRFGLTFEEIEGSCTLLRRLIAGEWDCDFVVIEPGQALALTHFLES